MFASRKPSQSVLNWNGVGFPTVVKKLWRNVPLMNALAL